MQTVCENLLAFKQTMRANDDILVFCPVANSTGADADRGLTFAYLEASFTRIATLLTLNQPFPFNIVAFY
jgi:hypothetical protein